MDYVVAPLAVFRPLTVPSIRRRWCESPSSFYSSVERDCVCCPAGRLYQPARRCLYPPPPGGEIPFWFRG